MVSALRTVDGCSVEICNLYSWKGPWEIAVFYPRKSFVVNFYL